MAPAAAHDRGLGNRQPDLLPLAAGFATALVAGLAAIAFLLAYLRRRSTAVFIGYRYLAALGLVAFVFLNR